MARVPQELELVRDFVNSLDVEDDRDELDSSTALTGWLRARGLVDEATEAGDDDLALARRLRRALRAALAGHHGDQADVAALAELDELGSLLPLRATFRDGEPGIGAVGPGVRAALARVLADVVVANCRGTWRRLKICPADDCAWVFYDESKNLSRRWCSMGVCGNRTKVRSYRARRGT